MNVLSLFDGMSCGQIALERAGVEVDRYYASEIDTHAIAVTKHNYPNTIHIGSVTDVDVSNLEHIDLLIGGSPCQSFSFAGKGNGMSTVCDIEVLTLEQYLELKSKGFEFEGQSYLFWEYIRTLRDVQKYNPNVRFLLENVRMVDKWKRIITTTLGITSVVINSNLVSAQNRWRQYWTNISTSQPSDRGVVLGDVIHETVDGLEITDTATDYMLRSMNKHDKTKIRAAAYLQYRDQKKSSTIVANVSKGVPYNTFFEALGQYLVPFDYAQQILEGEVVNGGIKSFSKDSMGNKVYYIHNMEVTLLELLTARRVPMDDVTVLGCISPNRLKKRQNGARFSKGLKFYTLTAQDRHGVLVEGYIRSITEVECERLQTLPDNYTEYGVSEHGGVCKTPKTARYKMIGNGWTVDVISHILKGVKSPPIDLLMHKRMKYLETIKECV